MASTQSTRASRLRSAGRRGAGMALLLALLAAVTVAKAWVSDDAYITLRTIDNCIHGYGLRWNPSERVQAYTHPLWMLLLAAACGSSREYYVTTMVVGLLVSAAAVFLFVRKLAPDSSAACLGVALLTASAAFTDFSTSGLENPLTHLLLVAFAIVAWAETTPARRSLGLATLAALLLVNRLDAGLLVLPVLVFTLVRDRWPAAAGRAVLGLAPLLAWEGFSLLYYGFPIPNSAVAKLCTGIPAGELLVQGVSYFRKALLWDPATLVVIAGGVVAAFARRDRVAILLAAGIVLHVLWVLRVGGDFMSGRFFTPPFVVAVAILARSRFRPGVAVGLGATALLLGGVSSVHTRGLERAYRTNWQLAIEADGIVDERKFYARWSALWERHGRKDWPQPHAVREADSLRTTWWRDGVAQELRTVGLIAAGEAWPPPDTLQASGEPYRHVVVRGAVGCLAFYLGPHVHVLDYHALGDPLLSRLPIAPTDPVMVALVPRMANRRWRIGHFCRRIPLGYVETVATGANRIRDPALARYYDSLSLVTRGPLLSRPRWAAIWRLNVNRGGAPHR